MKLLQHKRLPLLLTLFASFLVGSIAHADPLPPQPEQVTHPVFGGTSTSLYKVDGLSPYGYVTQQDMSSVMAGYGLTNLPKTAVVPFNVNTAGASSLPNVNAADPVSLLIGSMLTPISQDNIKSYLTLANNAFEKKQITSTTSYADGVANVQSASDSSDFSYNNNFTAPYNVASLFHFTPPSGGKDDPQAYQANPGNVYISLASGALTPQFIPNADKTPPADYMIQLRRIAAIQSAGVYALEDILKRSMPLSGADANLYSALSNNTFPKKADQTKPLTAHDLEKYMATRRLDPNSGWYNHVQQASPAELQREQLYLQSEILYELYQIHHTEEVNQALLAVSLLSQNYNNRAYLNQQAMQPSSASGGSVPQAK